MIATLKHEKAMNRSPEDMPDRIIALSITMYFIVNMVNLVVKQVFVLDDFQWRIVTICLAMIEFIFIALSFCFFVRRSITQFLITESIFLFCFIISYLLGYSENELLLTMMFRSMAVGVPLGIAAFSLKNQQKLLESLLSSRFLLCAVGGVGLVFTAMSDTYNMQIGYAIVIPTILCIYSFLTRKNVIDLIVSVISFGLVFIAGSRGALVCIAVFCFLYLFFYRKHNRGFYLIVLALILCVLIVLFLGNYLMVLLGNAFGGIDMKGAYALNSLLSGNFFKSGSRIRLFTHYISMIGQKPLFGYGVYGGFITLEQGPHNMIIELLLAFGVPIGIVLTLFFLSFFVRSFRIEGSAKIIALVFWSFNFPFILVRGDWMEHPEIFIFMGLIVSFEKSKAVSKVKAIYY